jgi:Cytochrome P450
MEVDICAISGRVYLDVIITPAPNAHLTYSKRYPQYPIFTLPAVTSRIYVVASPSLAAEVQRKRTLMFDPIVPDITARVLGLDPSMIERMRVNVDRAEGNWGILPNLHDSNNTNLGIGELLDNLTIRVVDELMLRLNSFGEAAGANGVDVDLLLWTQRIFTPASACGFYGPDNPLAKNPALEVDFWDFDHGIGSLLMGAFPTITASRPYYARERLVEAFKPYLQSKLYSTASGVVQKRIELLDKHNFSLDSAARSELSFLFAGIINTTVTSFWLVLRIFANPTLLQEIRHEICEAHNIDSLIFSNSPSTTDLSLRISTLKLHCPLLNAASRESMRLGSDAPSTRLVTAETTLHDKETGDSYTLLAGSIVQIAGAAMHASPRIWGADVNEFNPRRFLMSKEQKAVATTQVNHPAAYRAFGGGSTLCPGRHLAASEVLVWSAAVIMAFDGPEKVVVPEKEDRRLPVHLCEPKKDVSVKLKWRGVKVAVGL